MFLKTSLLEAWAILRVMNLIRISNAFKTIASYFLSRTFRKINFMHKPYAVSIEPTSICNLKCPECPTGTNMLNRPRGNIDLDNYRKMLEQLSPELIYLNLYVQGEPTMHPFFAEMVSLANTANLYTSTSTNGQFINPSLADKIVESGLTRLIFSMDGYTQKSYEKYRVGGNLNKIIDGIKNINTAKKNQHKNYPLVIIQFLVFEHNEHEIKDIRNLAKQLEADKLEIKTAQFNDFSEQKIKPPRTEKYRRYHLKEELQLKGKMHNHCWRQWHSAVISWDGQLSPCCYDKDAKHTFGNLNHNSVSQLWFGTESNTFKQQIIKDKKSIKICQNCPEGRSFWS